MAIFTLRIFTFGAVSLFVFGFLPHRVLTEWLKAKPNLTLIETEGHLYHTLLTNYNRHVRPSVNGPVLVNLQLSPHTVDLDEHSMTFKIHGYLTKTWDDARFHWKPSEYNNQENIRIPVQNIWYPDIVLYNFVEQAIPSTANDDVLVLNSGSVFYMHRLVETAVCVPDMSKFPFDTQTCNLIYGSMVYNGLEVNISSHFSSLVTSDYVPNNKWELVSAETEVNIKMYTCCVEPYPSYRVTFVLRRKSAYFSHVLVFPAMLIGVLVPFLFLLPPDSKERITLGMLQWTLQTLFFFVIFKTLSNGKSDTASSASRGRLIKHLLETSNTLVLPDANAAVNVTLDLYVNNIQMDEQERKFTVDGYFSQKWTDVSLSWNASDYDNMEDIRLPAKYIWTPDIILYNYRGVRNPPTLDINVYLKSSGEVTYIPPVTHSAVCAFDMSKFPFDIQTCKLSYGSWVYDASIMNLTSKFRPIIEDGYVPNEKWEIVSATSEIQVQSYSCCIQSYVTYVVTFVLRRHLGYSGQVLIVPAIIIAALIPFMFLLPSESKERITLGIALVVISVIQINVISNWLAKSQAGNPVILTYHVLTLILVALSVILSIFILNIYNRGPRRKKMPQILRTIFLKGLRKLVCLGDDTYHPTDEQETMSMRGKDVVVGVNDEKPPQTSGGNMDEINKHMQSLAQRDSVLDARQEVLAEWQQMKKIFLHDIIDTRLTQLF
ncbi:neuronal acetylcholine receptor subunit alpha-7 [Octopus bimaculoides]|nr:neuronal acetylcholine receptor subunit alpha-7 [Octopus bimaculoides]